MNYIVEALEAHHDIFEDFVEVHLFGSAVFSDQPGDVDLLLVYGLGTDERLGGRAKAIAERLDTLLPGLPVDLTILSERELERTRFLDAVSSHRIV